MPSLHLRWLSAFTLLILSVSIFHCTAPPAQPDAGGSTEQRQEAITPEQNALPEAGQPEARQDRAQDNAPVPEPTVDLKNAPCQRDPKINTFCVLSPCQQRGQWKCRPDGRDVECVGEIKKAPEVCDGYDNDCDGQIDEDKVCPSETQAWIRRLQIKPDKDLEHDRYITHVGHTASKGIHASFAANVAISPENPWYIDTCQRLLPVFFTMTSQGTFKWGAGNCEPKISTARLHANIVSDASGGLYTFDTHNDEGYGTYPDDAEFHSLCAASRWTAKGRRLWLTHFVAQHKVGREISTRCHAKDIALSPKGEVYVLGTYYGEMSINKQKQPRLPNKRRIHTVFIAKLDAQGKLIRFQNLGEMDEDFPFYNLSTGQKT